MPKTVIRTQMPGGRSRTPSMTPSGGVYDHNSHPPFTRKHDTGNGGIPLKFEESMRPSKAASVPSMDKLAKKDTPPFKVPGNRK
jgi:hypothetical protein